MEKQESGKVEMLKQIWTSGENNKITGPWEQSKTNKLLK